MKNKKLIAKRKSHRLPVWKMAKVIGVSHTCLMSMEAGNPGRIKTATKVANFYGCEPVDLNIEIYHNAQVDSKFMEYAKKHNIDNPIDIQGIKESARLRASRNRGYLND
jgi:DNA-binding XRE family transcriptional regulator